MPSTKAKTVPYNPPKSHFFAKLAAKPLNNKKLFQHFGFETAPDN
jgi:hypothetical protein